jgi:hypothetical protein
MTIAHLRPTRVFPIYKTQSGIETPHFQRFFYGAPLHPPLLAQNML